jgi:hypothetical protein
MRISFAAAAALVAIAVVPMSALPALPAHASNGPKSTSLTRYNGSLAGKRQRTDDGPPYFKAIGPAISTGDLGKNGYATLATTVRTNPWAANWSTHGMLAAAGFLRVIPGESVSYATPLASPAHDGDPIILEQFNSGTKGYCTNNKFMVNGKFAFGADGKCGTVPGRTAYSQSPLPTLHWTVTLQGNGHYQAAIALMKGARALATERFSAKLPGTAKTEFVPVLRLRVGSDTGDKMANPNSRWRFTVADTRLTVYIPRPGPLPRKIRRYFVHTGFGGMARFVNRHHPG